MNIDNKVIVIANECSPDYDKYIGKEGIIKYIGVKPSPYGVYFDENDEHVIYFNSREIKKI
jgi:hypothetical protein